MAENSNHITLILDGMLNLSDLLVYDSGANLNISNDKSHLE
jgi:hypothetical protein